jgi:hypothetical protein
MFVITPQADIPPKPKPLDVIWVIRPAPFAKIFLFSPNPNHRHIEPVSSHLKGRIAIVTDAGRDAVDATCASDEGAHVADGESVWS